MIRRETKSLCPDCVKIIDATVYEQDGQVCIEKTCPEHGEVVDIYWEDSEMYKKVKGYARDGFGILNPHVDFSGEMCPMECGLCKRHKSHTALANIVATNRCDLACWYCFFYAKSGEPVYEPTIDQIRTMVRTLKNEKPVGANAVQITGGEPSLREDLEEIIAVIKEEGIDHVQFNTNGIKLSQDPEFAKMLRTSGVNTVYLSYDGTSSRTNHKNHYEIPLVMKHLRKAELGAVLVPTVINGVNDNEVGSIVNFALENIDIIRGVNFQPISIVGRVPRKERMKMRITIPGVIERLEEQTDGLFSKDDFYPVPCISSITDFVKGMTGKHQYDLSIHYACGAATYLYSGKDGTMPITRFIDVEGLLEYLNEMSGELEEGKSRVIVGGKFLYKLGSFIDKKRQPSEFNMAKILYNALVKHDYRSLGEFHKCFLFIGLMHFMDLYNYDVARVEQCDIHYALPDGRIIPFCAFNVVPDIYREDMHAKFSISAEEWEKIHGRSLKDDRYIRDKEELKEKMDED